MFIDTMKEAEIRTSLPGCCLRTKVQLANEIGDYTHKLVEDYEDLDKVTIQADLWHSKYQASRYSCTQVPG